MAKKNQAVVEGAAEQITRPLLKVAPRVAKGNRAQRRAAARAPESAQPETIERRLPIKKQQAELIVAAQQQLEAAQGALNNVALGIIAAHGLDTGSIIGVDPKKLEVVVRVPKPVKNGAIPAPKKRR